MQTQHPVSPEFILTTEGFSASDDLQRKTAQKVEKLFRHRNPPLVRLRLHILRETPRGEEPRFITRALAEHQGADCITHADALEPELSAFGGLEKLERMLNAEAGARKHTQRHPHGIEVPSSLPKV